MFCVLSKKKKKKKGYARSFVPLFELVRPRFVPCSVGIMFPIATPRGRSSKFPWKGMSQVTYVTMVPWIGNETLRPLGCVPCFGRKLQAKKWMMCPPGVPYIAVAPVVTSWAVAGQQVVFLYCMLQTWVTLKAFPIETPRGRSVSFPIQGTMVT